MRLAHRFVPLIALALALLALWASGVGHWLNWATLARNQAWLANWVALNPLLAPAVYVLLYATATALSLPEAAVLTVAGGLLFSTWLGGALAVVGSTTGAVILFAAARSAFAPMMERRAGPRISRMRAELQRSGFLYLLSVRLVPLFQFWFVNLAAALAGMRLLPYVGATLLGIIPSTIVYAAIGSGIGDVLADGRRPDLSIVFSPAILGPLVGLAVLALLPIIWRHWKRANA
jgi:uncharacterized membrane protein YdjX (TVP38/TMEM64 family)